MSLEKRYTPQTIESKWYQHWLEKKYFHSKPDEREAYTIVIPPPNVTGVLHMGHMLNNTIQDVLIRRARLQGYNTCWVPGTDHASIATEAKVVKKLRAKGIKKSDLTREEFMQHAWEWKEEYGGIILDQLKKLGASCDWDRTRFTMEDKLSKAVLKVFVDLYKKGKIYRGLRMTNWDPEALTVLSNEEVIHSDEHSKLYHVRYKIANSDEWVTIATTRPETILGDSAVAVHPKDERYAHLKGKKAIIPMVNREVPIIFDRYVTMEFGTGALKVTPAHDMNDYEIGLRHNLEVIDTLNANGTMSEAAQFYIGEDRFSVRKKIVKDLEALGHIVNVEDYQNKVGRSERTNAIIEPRLTEQWFVSMKEFAATGLKAVETGEVNFHPKHFYNMYHNWLNEDNIKDWCISRQLWWGQRIPAWYYEGEVFVAETAQDALNQAQEKFKDKNLTLEDLKQDEDVLDTWFSSWLWPISVFDGFEKQDELKYYYPTNVLVTGWDIMFFWVARMVMAGYEWSEDLLGKEHIQKYGKQPFKHVYYTGMVRDEQRRKMSKSLGNSPDALELLDNYGADGVRFGMLSSAAAGNDILFDAPYDKTQKKTLSESEKCNQGLNFANKIWQALRLIKGWQIEDKKQPKVNTLAAKWMDNRFNQALERLDNSFKDFRLSEALMDLYNFTWGDFCSWYLEMIKPPYGEAIDRKTYEQAIGFFEKITIILHPFMPFVTEEIWHNLNIRKEGEDCIISQYPKVTVFDEEFLKTVENAKELITKIREARAKIKGLKKHTLMQLYVEKSNNAQLFFDTPNIKELIMKMGVLDVLEMTTTEPESSVAFIAGTEKYYLIVKQEIDKGAETVKLKKEKQRLEGFLIGIAKKLSNERFVNNAPEKVVALERKKQADTEAKIKLIEEQLKSLSL